MVLVVVQLSEAVAVKSRQQRAVYHELLKPNDTITAELQLQLLQFACLTCIKFLIKD